jgi:hypothetical protein
MYEVVSYWHSYKLRCTLSAIIAYIVYHNKNWDIVIVVVKEVLLDRGIDIINIWDKY